jgi:CheY-like chemotaxis protein/anti-sigma regulatory factor (Ser/Thr protein kinase)
MDAKSQQLRLVLPERAVWLEADPARLEQVLTNLLQNAVKFTQDGGEIELRGEQDGSEVMVRIKDNGAGISPDLLQQVFEPFTQADTSLDRSAGGLGLGLTLVKRLVELHGGRVEVHSSGIGQGSEFIVRLSVAAAPNELKSVGISRKPTGQQPLKVLVVEDNLDTAQMLAELVASWGHDVRLAYDGLQALAVAKEYRPHLVLLDIGLPRLDGYQVAERLRQELRLNRAIVVAVTGYGTDEDRIRSRAAGFDEHIVKPVQPDVLHELFSEVYPYNGPVRNGY